MNCNLSVNIYINFKYNVSLTRTGNFLALGDRSYHHLNRQLLTNSQFRLAPNSAKSLIRIFKNQFDLSA